jgi:anaerobic selenocysteine-containing dehydrogenase
MANPDSVRRAGFTGSGFEPGEKLFDRVLTGEGVVFTLDDYENAWDYVRRPDRRFTLEVPELLERMRALADEPSSWVTEEFPFVLSAGERRAFTANTIIRDPSWRRRDGKGALRISPADAAALGVETGDPLRVITERGRAEALVEVTEMMQAGHVSLPNGLGVSHDSGTPGVAPNELTSLHHRDFLAGTPWHKYVPARLERMGRVSQSTAVASVVPWDASQGGGAEAMRSIVDRRQRSEAPSGRRAAGNGIESHAPDA